MNKIDTLLEEIKGIEAEAGKIPADDKAALYDLLIGAYFKAMDVIEMLKTTTPEPVIQIDTDEVDRLTHQLKETTAKAAETAEMLAGMRLIHDKLKALLWKD